MDNTEIVRRSLLPGLVGLAAGTFLWWLADGWRVDRAIVEQQIATTQKLLRSDPDGAGRPVLEQQQESLKQMRAAWRERLADDADLQLVRARVFYDLRQRCYEIKLNCLIRLSEVEAPEKTGGQSARGAGDSLLRLGVSRVRATVSGVLGEQDLTDVLSTFTQDGSRVWRFNRVQVKGRGFEIDIERHVMVGKESV